ncbi:UNVERIFIED_ORG: uncharacterized protein (DUF1501 family) [Martelella mediterranea]
MSIVFNPTRRFLLGGACSLAAMPLMTSFALAEGNGDNRFVAIILRGAMDGLDLVQPYGDPAYAALRPELALTPDRGLHDLDGRFGLHPAAGDLYPLWQSGELSFVHAVSTPYRNARSHFDGQDILETGGSGRAGKDGWLNRAIGLSGQGRLRAIDVASDSDLILQGENDAEMWSPKANVPISADEIMFFESLYGQDEDFARAFQQARSADMSADEIFGGEKLGASTEGLAKLAGGFLKENYRVAAFSINGWDTHAGQPDLFRRSAGSLSSAILTLKNEMGPAAWRKTVVLAMTEFGRTARQNGTGGTDHGTGGCAVIAGGAFPGGRVMGNWPGIGDADLYENRDLMPTGDIREVAAALLYRQFGLGAAALTNSVFPGLDFSPSSVFVRA